MVILIHHNKQFYGHGSIGHAVGIATVFEAMSVLTLTTDELPISTERHFLSIEKEKRTELQNYKKRINYPLFLSRQRRCACFFE